MTESCSITKLKCPVCGTKLNLEKDISSESASISKKDLLNRAFERVKSESSPSASCQYPKYAMACTCCIVPDGVKVSDGKSGGNWEFPYHINRCPKHRD